MTDEKQQLYRVKWVSLLTNTSGYGTDKLTLAEAEAWVDALNKYFKGIVDHYCEPIKEGENDD